MRRVPRWGMGGAISLTLAVGVAAVASGAVAGAYQGTTSQRQAVSFKLSSGEVSNFKIVILDKCPDGHTLRESSTYPTMKVKQGKFGGKFVPVGAHKGETATLNGTVGRRKVTGSLKDTSFSKRERALCHGSATFTAHHVIPRK